MSLPGIAYIQHLDAQIRNSELNEIKAQISADFAAFLAQAQDYGAISLWDITAIIEERFKQETSPCTGCPLTCQVILRDVQEAKGWY
jgi:hypothetical protein